MIVVWTVLTALVCVCCDASAPRGNVVVTANFEFSSALYSAIVGSSRDSLPTNECFSPLGLQLLFSLLYLGAKGEAARILASVLHLPDDRPLVAEGYRELMTSDLLSAVFTNKIFVSLDVDVEPEFENAAVDVLRASVDHVDFSDEEDAKVIDVWLTEVSHGKLTQLNMYNFVDSTRRALFVHGANFKGEWLHRFNAENTHPGLFHVGRNRTVQVRMMSVVARFRTVTDSRVGAHVVQVPYIGRHGPVSFVIVMPLDEEGMTRFEARLRDGGMSLADVSDLGGIEPAWLRLSMPRFNVSESEGLQEALIVMGLQRALDRDAEMYAGLSQDGVDRSYVLHDAEFDVDEDGTMASLSAYDAVERAGDDDDDPPPLRPDRLVINRPFVFLVRCETTGVILFLGRFSQP